MDSIHEILNSAVKALQEKQDQLVLDRLKEYLGYEIDLKFEATRRFPRIKIEHWHDGSYHYYWNDGTEQGYRIISFYPTPIDYTDIDTFKISSGYTYN